MSIAKRARRAAIALAFVPFAVVALVAVLTVLEIPIGLSWLRPRLEAVTAGLLGRDVRIDGPVVLVPALVPTVEVGQVHIANSPGWTADDLATLQSARLSLGILPLLDGDIRIEEVAVEGVTLALETRSDGSVNWLSGTRRDRGADTSSDADPGPDGRVTSDTIATDVDGAEQVGAPRFSLDAASFSNIVVTYGETHGDWSMRFELNQLSASAPAGESIQVIGTGSIQDVEYTITLDAGSLAAMVSSVEAWPVSLRMAMAGVAVGVDGSITDPLRGRGIDLMVSIQADRLADLAPLTDGPLPDYQDVALTARLTEEAGVYALQGIQGQIEDAAFSGEVALALRAVRPRLTGAIDIPIIDLSQEAALVQGTRALKAPPTAPPAEREDRKADLDAVVLTLPPFAKLEADLELTIGTLEGVVGTPRDIRLGVHVADETLTAPVEATVADIPFTGTVDLKSKSGRPTATLALSASDADISALSKAATGLDGISGRFASGDVLVTVSGPTLRDVIESADLYLGLDAASLSYGHGIPDADPVAFTLDAFEFGSRLGKPTSIVAVGTLLEEPFELVLTAGDPNTEALAKEVPVQLVGTGEGTEFGIDGSVLHSETGWGAELDVVMTGEEFGALAAWLGVNPESQAPFAVEATVRAGRQQLSVSDVAVRLGETALTGDLDHRRSEAASLTTLELAIENLNVDEVVSALSAPEDEARDTEHQPFTLDLPILPTRLALDDADFDVSATRVDLTALDVTDFEFKGSLRDGWLPPSEIAATAFGVRTNGTVALDMRGDEPQFEIALTSAKANAGRILDALGVIDDLDLVTGPLTVKLKGRGSSPREILERSNLSATARNSRLVLQDANTGASVPIDVSEGRLSAAPRQPVSLSLQGAIDRIPVTVDARTAPLAEYLRPRASVDVDMEIALLDTRIAMAGSARLPLDRNTASLTLSWSGQRLDSLNELLDVSMPPFGPYSMKGRFEVDKAGYRLSDLNLRVGSSDLSGAFAITTSGAKPRLDVELRSNSLQLDDFETGAWSPREGGQITTSPEEKTQVDDAARALMSPAVMRSQDARIDVAVGRVVSGADELGAGRIVATLEGGRFTVDPLRVEVPGGAVDIGFAYEPLGDAVAFEARADVVDFDYGILARRLDPTTDLDGVISLDVDVNARGADLDEIMNAADGHVDFAIRPRNLEAGVFDLWSVNLLIAVLPSLTGKSQSRINCVVGRFPISNGIMTPRALLIDSTRIQASGDGRIDFPGNRIEMKLVSRPKRPQFFSAQTPIKVEGNFEDFDVGVGPGAVIGTVARMATSIVTTPFEWVFSEKPPKDGRMPCAKAWGRPLRM